VPPQGRHLAIGPDVVRSVKGAPVTVSARRYTAVAIGLHWLMALIIIGNLAGGLLADDFRESTDPAMVAWARTIIGLHKAMGLLVIGLTLVRIGWRLANPPPPLPAHMTPMERRLSGLTHVGFYGLMLALPLTGWALVSTAQAPRPISMFGLFEIGHLPLPAGLHDAAGAGHERLGWAMIATLVLHVLAAAKHQLFDRDNLLARMRV
jgi:cytochrome b561